MKRFSLLVLSGFVAFAFAQQRIVFRDSKKNTRVQIEGNQGFFIPDKSFELTGNVIVKQIVEKLTMTCAKATGDFVKVAGKTEFDNVRLTGGVKVTKASDTTAFGATGNSADYDIKGDQRVIKLNGDVTLDFRATGSQTSTWNAKASSATVTVNKSDNFLDAANLSGPLTFNGTEVERSGKTTKFTVKAQTFNYRAKGESGNPEIRLEKNIEMSQEGGDQDAEITGAQLLVLELNKENQITKIRFSSGGEGQIKSTFIQTKKGGR